MIHQLKHVDAHAPGLCCITQLLAELHDAPGRLLGLAGYRGDAAGDLDAAARRLARLSELICDLEDTVAEIEINPLIVTATGTHVADALVRRRDIKRA